jgi:endonuclease/exonuclease/phosphatase family metal-dependent hydrolase
MMANRKGLPLLKVATLNTWHGLDGHGTLRFGCLESRAERMARLNRQVTALKNLNADILLLQELNPLPFRAHWYASKLGMRATYVTCNSGIKLGWGPPFNLNEGVGIFFPTDWQYQVLGKKRLSGEFRLSPFRISAINNPFYSFQLHESRVAFAVRLFIPPEKRVGAYEGRTSLIAVVAHLHVSPAQTPRNQQIVQQALEQGHITKEDVGLILRSFKSANTRRLNEVENLLTWIETLRRPDEPVIMGGDFNCEPESPPYNAIVRRGWSDLWSESGNPDDLLASATWDAPRNSLTARVKDFQHALKRKHPNVAEVLKETDSIPRRIDFLFGLAAKQTPSQKEFQLGSSGCLGKVTRFGYLTGNPIGEESLICDDFSEYQSRQEFVSNPGDDSKFISDHHGIYAEFGLN